MQNRHKDITLAKCQHGDAASRLQKHCFCDVQRLLSATLRMHGSNIKIGLGQILTKKIDAYLFIPKGNG